MGKHSSYYLLKNHGITNALVLLLLVCDVGMVQGSSFPKSLLQCGKPLMASLGSQSRRGIAIVPQTNPKQTTRYGPSSTAPARVNCVASYPAKRNIEMSAHTILNPAQVNPQQALFQANSPRAVKEPTLAPKASLPFCTGLNPAIPSSAPFPSSGSVPTDGVAHGKDRVDAMTINFYPDDANVSVGPGSSRKASQAPPSGRHDDTDYSTIEQVLPESSERITRQFWSVQDMELVDTATSKIVEMVKKLDTMIRLIEMYSASLGDKTKKPSLEDFAMHLASQVLGHPTSRHVALTAVIMAMEQLQQ